jgi:WD40 repeat protein
VLWDWAAGKARHNIEVEDGVVTGLDFTPDGKLVTTANNSFFRRWDVGTGKLAEKPSACEVRVMSMAMSRNAKLMAVCEPFASKGRGRPRLFDLSNDKEILPRSDQPVDPFKVAFETASPFPDPHSPYAGGVRKVVLPDGRMVEQDPKHHFLRLLDAKTAKELRRFDNPFSDFACSPDGKTLAILGTVADSPDWQLRFLDLATGAERTVWKAKPGFDIPYLFSPDGQTLAITHNDNSLRLWDVASGEDRLVLDYAGFRESIAHLAFSRDGKRLLAGNREKTLAFVWDIAGANNDPADKAARETKLDLTPKSFASFHALIRPHEQEWRHLKVAWLTDVVAARQRAAAEDKPIVICYTGGAGYNEPLGVC